MRSKQPTSSVTLQSAGPTPTASSTSLQPSSAAVSTAETITEHTEDRTYEVIQFHAVPRVVVPPSTSSKTGNDADEKTEVAFRGPESSSAPKKRWSQPALPIPQPTNCSEIAADKTKEVGDVYIARWDCEASAENELTFNRGDRILIVSREYEQLGWWVGQLVVDGLSRHDGLGKVIGLIPKDFVEKAL